MKTHCSWLAPVLALSLPSLVVAQQADATDAKAPSTHLRYQSAFADYKPWQEIKPGNWRQLNDQVAPAAGAAGGHAGHNMRTTAPTAAPAPASKASELPASPHKGHDRHGGKP